MKKIILLLSFCNVFGASKELKNYEIPFALACVECGYLYLNPDCASCCFDSSPKKYRLPVHKSKNNVGSYKSERTRTNKKSILLPRPKKLKNNQTKGDKIKRYFCECGSGYTNKRNLRAHVKAVHEGRLLFCEFCQREFASFSGYKRHIDGHLGVRFKCMECFKEYSNPQTFKRHVCKP